MKFINFHKFKIKNFKILRWLKKMKKIKFKKIKCYMSKQKILWLSFKKKWKKKKMKN